MVNHYKVLKVSSKASNAEIKSAYRRLARKFHPDLNEDAEGASLDFAKIAKAYEVLGNPKARAVYDKHLLKAQYSNSSNDDSVFSSDNQHARRWRQMVYERRYNEIIDRMIADERRESIALQKVIFPVVALFLSTCFVAIFKPTFWTQAQIPGKFVLFSLFIVGLIHLFNRIRSALERYTYKKENIHDSIFEEAKPLEKPYTRFAAICFLIGGFGISLGLGLLIGNYMQLFIVSVMPTLFSTTLKPEIVFYPPIFVLLVDVMHTFASNLD